MKIATLDLETSPNLAWAFQLWDTNISASQLVQSTDVMCWAWKWLGDKEMIFRSTHHDGRESMIRDLHALLTEADGLITYNGKRFDEPFTNRLFLEYGLDPPAPYRSIDLYETVKRKFKFPSNKLDYVCKQLGLGGKKKHDGFDLWARCLAGDQQSWETMKKYNIQDVYLTEKLYKKLLPWIVNHPSHGAMIGEDVCPNCASKNLNPEGFSYTATGRFQRFVCGDCGKWSKSSKRDQGTSIISA